MINRWPWVKKKLLFYVGLGGKRKGGGEERRLPWFRLGLGCRAGDKDGAAIPLFEGGLGYG